MSRSFDIKLNNIMSNQAPGYSEYEKSVLLTQSQNDVIIALYNGLTGDSFEETEEYTTYLSPLIRQAKMEPEVEPEEEELRTFPHIVEDSYIFKLPEDMMFRTYESCIITSEDDKCIGEGRNVIIIPVTQDEFWRTYNDPFRGPNAHKVLRLAYDITDQLSLNTDVIIFNSDGGSDNIDVTTGGQWVITSGAISVNHPNKYVELVSKFPIAQYKLRYVRYPDPIILEDLSDGLTIEGYSTRMPCALNPQIHERIVDGAVNLAKSIWS